MRKYLIGFLAGILVATAGVAAADTISLVGKKIQSEAIVTLDGEEIGKAIITDGTSFAPLRIVAEAVGVGVEWEKGVVKMETQANSPKTEKQLQTTLESLERQLESANKIKGVYESVVQNSHERIDKWKNTLSNLATDASEQVILDYTNRVADAEASLNEAELQLAAQQAKVAEIEQEIIYVKVQLAASK